MVYFSIVCYSSFTFFRIPVCLSMSPCRSVCLLFCFICMYVVYFLCLSVCLSCCVYFNYLAPPLSSVCLFLFPFSISLVSLTVCHFVTMSFRSICLSFIFSGYLTSFCLYINLFFNFCATLSSLLSSLYLHLFCLIDLPVSLWLSSLCLTFSVAFHSPF